MHRDFDRHRSRSASLSLLQISVQTADNWTPPNAIYHAVLWAIWHVPNQRRCSTMQFGMYVVTATPAQINRRISCRRRLRPRLLLSFSGCWFELQKFRWARETLSGLPGQLLSVPADPDCFQPPRRQSPRQVCAPPRPPRRVERLGW